MKVFIVEDEHWIIKYIRNMMDWPAMGMEVAGEARDGETALELLPTVCPDIVLMDINLPFLNGLETSEKIKEAYPHIKIILLTGYGEFQYAKEAIRLGVYRYLLKPIDAEELKNALESAAAEIRNEKALMQKLHKSMHREHAAMKVRFLNQWMTGEGTESGEAWILRQLEKFQIQLLPDQLIVSLFVIDDHKRRYPEERELQWRKYVVQNVAQEMLAKNFSSVVFASLDDSTAAITSAGTADAVAECGESIRHYLHRHFDFTVTVAVGQPCSGYSNIRQSYLDAQSAIERRFTAGTNRIFIAGPEDRDRSDPSVQLDDNQKNDWLMDLRLGRFDSLEEKIRHFFRRCREKHLTKEAVMFYGVDIFGLFQAYCRESHVSDHKLQPGKEAFVKSLQLQETIEEMELVVLELFREVQRMDAAIRKSPAAKMADRALAIIGEHYANEDLSLNWTAGQLYVSPFYLSKVFKKELNKSFSEYVNDYRMNMAKRMLDQEPSILLSQVAERVGFNDPYYFSKCFKKQFGLTPSQYLERKRI